MERDKTKAEVQAKPSPSEDACLSSAQPLAMSQAPPRVVIPASVSLVSPPPLHPSIAIKAPRSAYSNPLALFTPTYPSHHQPPSTYDLLRSRNRASEGLRALRWPFCRCHSRVIPSRVYPQTLIHRRAPCRHRPYPTSRYGEGGAPPSSPSVPRQSGYGCSPAMSLSIPIFVVLLRRAAFLPRRIQGEGGAPATASGPAGTVYLRLGVGECETYVSAKGIPRDLVRMRSGDGGAGYGDHASGLLSMSYCIFLLFRIYSLPFLSSRLVFSSSET
ncbi:hypothetical protein C8F01DRAFT_117953 [Mycena amicta]|nr:hypothetical protein C8F01DRAFT_117953 [Mycena amicta]